MLQRHGSILGCLIAIPILILLAAGSAWAESGTVEVALNSTADDAEEDHLGNVTLNEPILDMGGNYRSLGLRFANLQIPVNAQITRAYIEFTTAAKDPILTTLSIRGQSSDSAPAFSGNLFDISTRTTYNNALTWVMDYPWDALNQVHQTPDLTEIVQIIVKRPGWQPGNALAFVITGTENIFRRAKSYDSDPNSAPKIHIEYADSVVDVTIAASTDDMHQDGFRGTVTNGPELLISASSTRVTGLRFASVNIPQGSLIKRAEVRFTASQAHPAETGTVNIHGYTGANSNRGTFATSIYTSVDYRSRQTPRTTYQQWSNFPALAAGQSFATDDITSIIQPIVGQTTWDASKTILLYFTSGSAAVTRRAYSQDYAANPSMAPTLHIEYIPPLGAGGSDWAVPTLDKVLVHRSCFEGSTADRQMFTLSDGAIALSVAGVSAAGIGFVLPADEGTCLRKLAEVSNQQADISSADEVYPLHPVIGDTAQYYNAGNEVELLTIFQTILGNFKKATFFASSPAVSSLQYKDRILVSSFNTETWTGDLLSVERNASGQFNQVEWSAYQNLVERASPRKVWTVDTSAATPSLVAYTDNDVLCKKIGPIINSAPVVAGPPPFFYPFDDYKGFANARAVTNPREAMVYIGANDGLLHAFKLEDGSESWAFMPPSMKTKLNDQFLCTDTYCHRYYMDASPKLADVRAMISGQNEWRTILVAGQRQGGTAYTALDVTAGKPFDAVSEPSGYLWEYPAPGQTDDDLGETWAAPEVERVKDGSGTVWGTFFTSGYAASEAQQANKQAYLYALDAYTGQPIWASGNKLGLGITSKYKLDYVNYSSTAAQVQPDVLLANGKSVWIYRNWGYWQGDNSYHECSFKVDQAIHDAATRKGTFFFETGSIKSPAPPYPDCIEPIIYGNTYFCVLDQVPYVNLAQNAWATGPPTPVAQANNALNSPLAADMDGDHIADTIYTGDLYGNMYRISNIGKGETPVSSVLCRFDPVPKTPETVPIRSKATYARSAASDTIWVYYGTGRFESEADKAVGATPQYLFGLKDKKLAANESPPDPYALPLATYPSGVRPLELRSCNYKLDLSGKTLRLVTGESENGGSWALRLGYGTEGERVLTKPLVVGGIVFFTTFVPDSDGCGGGGETYVFALDYASGLPTTHAVFDLDGDGKFTDADKVEVTQADGTKKKVVPAGIRVGRGVGSQPVLFKNTLYITTTVPQLGTIAEGSSNLSGLHALAVNIPNNRVLMESWKHN